MSPLEIVLYIFLALNIIPMITLNAGLIYYAFNFKRFIINNKTYLFESKGN